MAETFHGRWRIRVTKGLGLTSFVVIGSDDADGRHRVEGRSGPAPAMELTVRGARWTVAIEEDVNGSWMPAVAQFPANSDGPRRSTKFVPGPGLTVTLETGGASWHPDLGDPLSAFLVVPLVRLECVCLDETTNPIPTPNPYDFTVPHGPRR